MAKRIESFADMLPWSHLAGPGMVFTKDSQIVAGYYFRPPDADSRTAEDAESLADHVNAALTAFGTGWTSWGDVISFPSGLYPAPSESHFPDPFSRAVDDARRRHFEAAGQHFENERAWLICYTPPPLTVSKLTDLLYTGGHNRVPTQQRIIGYFNDVLERFENRIAGAIGLRRMTTFEVEGGRQDELVNYLNYCATGKVHGIMLPKAGAHLDLLIAGQEISVGENPIIGRDYIGTVSIDGIPAETLPNVISALNAMAMPYRFSQRMIYLDTYHALKEIKRYRDRWKQKMRGLGQMLMKAPDAAINEHAAQMKQEADAAMAWAESGMVKYGYYSPAVIVRHPDPLTLKEWTDAIEKVLAGCGFGSRTETTNTVETFRGALPGDTYCNVRLPIIHTRTASDLLPLSGIWTGEAYAPCPMYPDNSPALLWLDTEGAVPFRFNYHIGPHSDVGHCIILGPTGNGKSTFVNTTALQARRYPGMHITCFDYKNGMMATVLACGGRHHDVANEVHRNGMLCPLGVLEDETDQEWAADYLGILYHLQTAHDPDSERRTDIIDAVRSLAAAPTHLRTMSNFVGALQNIEARRVFEFYTMKGTAGRFLDGVADPDDDSDFLVYETEDLMTLGDQVSLATLLYQFRRFERSLNGQPSILFLAEAWQVIGHEIWRKRLDRWLRTLRSKNCIVVMDTQSLADIAGSPMLTRMVEACQRKVFLPNSAAMQSTGLGGAPGPYELYRIFGLNDRQITIIKNATPKQEYYITGPDGCRKVSLRLSPIEMAISAGTSQPDVEEIRSLVRRHGDGWLTEWLAAKGIPWNDGIQQREAAYA